MSAYEDLREDEILCCFLNPIHERVEAVKEHGHWWVNCFDCAAAWSVHLCSGPEALSFEEVSEGHGYCHEEALKNDTRAS